MAHEYLITNISANNLLKYFQPGETLRYKFNGVEYTDTVKSFYQEPMSESPEEYEYFYVGKLPDYDEMETSGDHSVYIYKDGYGDLNAFIISYDDVTSFKIFGGMKDIPTVVYVEDESTIEPKLKEAYLPEEVMTESEEGYIISKALNDLNQRIIDIDVTDQLEKVKQDIEDNSIWVEENNGLKTKNALRCGTDSIVVGRSAQGGSNTIVLGATAASTYHSVSIGDCANSSWCAISIGNNSNANASYAISIGNNSKAGRDESISIGDYNTTNNKKEISLGCYNSSSSVSSSSENSSGNTHFSIAAPSATSSNRKNIFEIMQDGKLFISGMGNYNGVYSSDARSVQDIIEDMSYVTASALTDLDERIKNINLSWNII